MTEHEIINLFSTSLAERLVEIRFVDINETKVAISTHIKAALYDLLKVQTKETEKKLFEAKKRFLSTKGDSTFVMNEIVQLKQKLKQENKLFAELDRQNQNKELILFLRKYNEPLLMDFYKYYDSIR
jgi:hypothetical protein